MAGKYEVAVTVPEDLEAWYEYRAKIRADFIEMQILKQPKRIQPVLWELAVKKIWDKTEKEMAAQKRPLKKVCMEKKTDVNPQNNKEKSHLH